MPFHFTCPYCFYKTKVDDSVAGQTGPCRNCGKEITVPYPETSRAGTSPELTPVGEQSAQDLLAENKRRRKLILVTRAAGAVLAIAVLVFVFVKLTWPAVDMLSKRRDRISCSNNLTRIAQALNEYAAEYGSYPPPVVYDKSGKAMHSWRVLILPQLGEMALYAAYDMDKAWDSIENSRLLGRAPSVFRTPSVTGSATVAGETNYFLIKGPGTLFPASGPLTPADATDGTDQTFLVVESDSSLTEWTNPVDIDISKLNTRIGASGVNTLGGSHDGGATVGFVDGSAGWLPDDTSAEIISGLISPAGGEPIDPQDFEIR